MTTNKLPTVGSEIKRLFPEGTQQDSRQRLWSIAPLLPVDVFAAAAHLLQESGAYQFLVAPFNSTAPGYEEFVYPGPTRSSSREEVLKWQKLGQVWSREKEAGRPGVSELWEALWNKRRSPLVWKYNKTPPAWWATAYALLVVADEASSGLGYTSGTTGNEDRWANDHSAYLLETVTDRQIISPVSGSTLDERHQSRHVALDSLSQVDRSVCRVLPKGRTTELGCTLRTFSHNLALLPPHGHANAYWHQTLNDVDSSRGSKLKVLAVPFPYSIANEAFRAMVSDPADKERRWGRFRIDQIWLNPNHADPKKRMYSTAESRKSFISFIEALIDAAGTAVNALLLPEYALDWDTYDDLVRHILDHHPEIEFLISGLSKDCNKRAGNLVACTTFSRDPIREAFTHSRRKHHRWMIDRSQIEMYQLGLEANTVWWEYLEIEQRVLQMDVFQSGSTLTAVICEDLARVDPGLTILRTLGPNLIFALLMDGPQMKKRWPSVYATSLADDPGSSVLSFTSMALIERSNQTYRSGSRAVALWRNRPLNPETPRDLDYTEINLEPASQALVINLMCAAADEITLDGRTNNDATAWYLESYSSVSLPPDIIVANGWTWITG